MYGCEEDGWEMEKKLLRSSLYRGCNIEEMAKIHSPKKDGNDPVKYARDILADSGVSPSLTFGEMDDATLERVMKAIKKEEGYYNLKETRIEQWIYTTNITVTDGIRPAAGATFKATLGTCEYSCKTDKYGRLAPIVHKTEGMTIDVKAANAEGQYETVYSAQAGNKSKNIILKRNLVQYKAHTLAHNPEPPHEKSQPKPIDYIIQSGDTLSEIAARYEVSVSELVENNGIKDPNKIYPGKKIVIYGKKEPDDVNSGEQSPQEGNGESYPVPPNDPTAGRVMAIIQWMDLYLREDGHLIIQMAQPRHLPGLAAPLRHPELVNLILLPRMIQQPVWVMVVIQWMDLYHQEGGYLIVQMCQYRLH
ncbi:LysM domain-containing protein [Escherichia coli]|nr:LysM domain-containing protein [Escherichia coli]EGO8379436.1 LysM domain-containing protein [Escherichia coli]